MHTSLISTASATRDDLRRRVLTLAESDTQSAGFEPLALDIFRYQATYNVIYQTYLQVRNSQPEQISELSQIPFLPIPFFKSHRVQTQPIASQPAVLEFASSGTTGQTTSRHWVSDADLYETVSVQTFEQQYGPLTGCPVLALLPSYLERNNSSLVYMVQHFMHRSGHPLSGFYLHNVDELTNRLRQLANLPAPPRRTLLLGVTFGLLDWAESDRDLTFLGQLPGLTVMETGGMKGRRQELLREEVHAILTNRLGVSRIHSEYGMTEMLSQAYSAGEGVFRPGPTMRVLLRDPNDPFDIWAAGSRSTGERRTGGINVIDLANLDSCAFLETQDLGQYVGSDGQFRVIGRFDNSDIRGCNLLVS